MGLSKEEVVIYLESKFTNGMTWGKFLDGKIHIDHIKPMSSFNLHNENELKRCMHHTNLQPLWARDNIRKGNKIIK